MFGNDNDDYKLTAEDRKILNEAVYVSGEEVPDPRIDALEAKVARLEKEVASLQQSRMASQAFGPINPIPKIGPGSCLPDPVIRPIELTPQLVEEFKEAMDKFWKDRKKVDGE